MNLPIDSSVALTDELVAGAASPQLLVPEGHAIATPAPLIGLISDEQVAELRARCAAGSAGTRSIRAGALQQPEGVSSGALRAIGRCSAGWQGTAASDVPAVRRAQVWRQPGS